MGKRNGKDAWQFRKGDKKGESIELAMYRELKEETGLEMPMLKFWENKDLALLRRSKEFNKKENRSFTRANDKFGSSYVLMVSTQI